MSRSHEASRARNVAGALGALAALLLAAGAGACSSSSGSAAPSQIVGETCNADAVCSSLAGGYCAKAGVCTRTCTLHSDCGCTASTTNGDLANGKCEAACVDGYCMKVCANNGQCFGTTTCMDPSSLGFSACY